MKSLVAAVVLLLPAALVAADEWPSASPAELAMQSPGIEPQADAEALLWEVRVAHDLVDGAGRTEMWHYLRVKIFSEAGRDRLGTVDIPFGPNHGVSDIAGRSIRPDGTIVELRKDSVYDRTLVRAGDLKVKCKSFALPGLEVGSIIEYRWKETIEYGVAAYFRLEFQRDIPVHLVRYHVKPITDPAFPFGMGSLGMHLKAAPFSREKDGYFTTSAARIPAFREERDMPPEAGVRPWLLIYYSAGQAETPERYWTKLGRQIFEGYQGAIRLNPEMRAAALEAVKGAGDDEARLRLLFDFVTAEVENTSYDLDEGDDLEERPHTKENRTTADSWKQKAGTGYDIALLYIALAEALGYEARLARVSRRDLGGFERSFTDPYFLRGSVVAVRLGDAWHFCDPAYPFLPFGLLHSNEQGQAALIADPKRPELVVTPVAPPGASETRREGKLRLAADGTLEGDVRIACSGHSASGYRARYRRQSAAAREESVRESVKRSLGASEVTGIVLDGLAGSRSLTIAYHLKVPGYAQRTGQRMFLQSALFSRNDGPRYTASDRHNPVMFANAWQERDELTYELPEGYSLENPESPGRITINGVGEYTAGVSLAADRRTLRYERSFDFGRGGNLMFPANAYPGIKRVFDRLHELDSHALSLKQGPR